MQAENIYGRKRTIYYARTYRRMKASKAKCILYFCLVIIPTFICLWLNIGTITKWMSEFAVAVLGRISPEIMTEIKIKNEHLFGAISYVGMKTIYPTQRMCWINAVIALALMIILGKFKWKGRPIAIYVVFYAAIHLVSCLWFILADKMGKVFPYTTTVYSELYVVQEIGIWLIFLIMTGMMTGIIGEKGFIIKFVTMLIVVAYSIVFGTIRYMVFLYLLQKLSVLYMALFYFMLGPMFDFMYLVMIYAIFINRMIKLYDSSKGREVWKWS